MQILSEERMRYRREGEDSDGLPSSISATSAPRQRYLSVAARGKDGLRRLSYSLVPHGLPTARRSDSLSMTSRAQSLEESDDEDDSTRLRDLENAVRELQNDAKATNAKLENIIDLLKSRA